MGSKRQDTGIFEGEIQHRAFAVLLLVSVPDEIGKTGLVEQVFYRMGAVTYAGKNGKHNSIRRKNSKINDKNEEL